MNWNWKPLSLKSWHFEASEDVMTKYKSQALHIIRIKCQNADGSGNPPSFIPVLLNIGMFLHKQATWTKHFDGKCIHHITSILVPRKWHHYNDSSNAKISQLKSCNWKGRNSDWNPCIKLFPLTFQLKQCFSYGHVIGGWNIMNRQCQIWNSKCNFKSYLMVSSPTV